MSITITIEEENITLIIAEGVSIDIVNDAVAAHAALPDVHHPRVTLGAGSDPALTLAGQELTLAAPHHAAVTLGAGTNPRVTLAGQELTVPLWMLNDYQRVVVVDAGGHGDYTDLATAEAAIVDASPTNEYGIIVMPGVYDHADSIALKPYVHIAALVPYSVRLRLTQTPTGFSWADYYTFVRILTAGTQETRVSGLVFDGQTFASALQIGTVGASLDSQFAFNNCRFLSAFVGPAPQLAAPNVHANGSFRMRHSDIIQSSSSRAYGIYFQILASRALVEDCYIDTSSNSGAVGTAAIYKDGGASYLEGVHRCRIRAGANQYACTGGYGATMAITHCISNKSFVTQPPTNYNITNASF